MTTFSVSYDYRCPFAKNMHLHLIEALREGAPWNVTFVPWTLSQVHREEGEPDAWDNPARRDDHVALAAGWWISEYDPDHFLDAHEALFKARHHDGAALKSIDEVRSALRHTGVSLEQLTNALEEDAPYKALGEAFRSYEPYESFGVPTFLLDGRATFVRYMKEPTGEEGASRRMIESLLDLMTNASDINEFKQTTVPY